MSKPYKFEEKAGRYEGKPTKFKEKAAILMINKHRPSKNQQGFSKLRHFIKRNNRTELSRKGKQASSEKYPVFFYPT